MSSNESIVHSDDEAFMQLALQLASKGEGAVEPNPMVGCVLIKNAQLVGRGYHHRFGGPHAEIDALNSLADPADAHGATAYVTLEPCCHHGKTPPCSQALIDAGIARVVAAMRDPFPRVDGGGLRQLRQAGIETEVGLLQESAEELNAPYLKRVRTGLPWTIGKWAMSVDGRIATASGESQWITGPTSRQAVHQLRSRVDAIVVGMGTVIADDPALTARLANDPPTREATRIVFCRHRLPASDSQLMRSAGRPPVLLVTGPAVDRVEIEHREQAGAEILRMESADPEEMVREALAELGRREMTNVMIEGGGELLASFFEAGQLDEFHVYLGAKVLGGNDAPGPIGGHGIRELEKAETLQLRACDTFGSDVRLIYRRPRT